MLRVKLVRDVGVYAHGYLWLPCLRFCSSTYMYYFTWKGVLIQTRNLLIYNNIV